MISKIIEAYSGFNWGKFMVWRPDDAEWSRSSVVGLPASVFQQRGWTRDHIWVMDLETGEGACFRPGGLASADLQKHQIWVCPLYEPFLTWLYAQDLSDLTKLPDSVELPHAEAAMYGYRRPGPDDPTKDDLKKRTSRGVQPRRTKVRQKS